MCLKKITLYLLWQELNMYLHYLKICNHYPSYLLLSSGNVWLVKCCLLEFLNCIAFSSYFLLFFFVIFSNYIWEFIFHSIEALRPPSSVIYPKNRHSRNIILRIGYCFTVLSAISMARFVNEELGIVYERNLLVMLTHQDVLWTIARLVHYFWSLE